MNRRQRERKLKAKKAWQSHIRRVRNDPYRAQVFYAGSFLPERIEAAVDAMVSRAINEAVASEYIPIGSLVTWNEDRTAVRNTNQSVYSTEELTEHLRELARLARTMSPASIDTNYPQSRLVGNGEPAYGDDMQGMTLDEFQAWSDQLIREVQGE